MIIRAQFDSAQPSRRWLARDGWIVLLALILASSPLTPAAEIHVSLQGNDRNPGTAEQPLATINQAAAIAQAGDTVWIHAGRYQPDTEISPANSGTAEAPIHYRPVAGAEVIIDGQLRLPRESSRKMGVISIENRNGIVLDGLKIINSRWAGVLVRNSTHVTIQNCSTQLTYGSGIIAALSSDIKVLRNSVRQACSDPGNPRKDTDECITLASVDRFEIAYNTVTDRGEDSSNGGEGIDTKNACRNGTVHHNVVHDLVRLGIYIDAYSKELSNIEVYANTVYRCRKGIVVACEEGGTARDLRIHDNLVYDCPRAGIQLAGYLKGGPIQDVAIYQNTVTRCGFGATSPEYPESGGLLIDARNPLNRNFIIRNNIFADNQTQIHSRDQAYLAIEHNLVHGVSPVRGTKAIEADPRFVDPVGNDFRLSPDSPAIDAALGEPRSLVDHTGHARPAAADLGAFEWRPATPSGRP